MCEACSSEGLEWRETDVSREDAPGVAHERTRTRNKAKELRDQLVQHFERSNQPVWVAVQNRGEHDPETSTGLGARWAPSCTTNPAAWGACGTIRATYRRGGG